MVVLQPSVAQPTVDGLPASATDNAVCSQAAQKNKASFFRLLIAIFSFEYFYGEYKGCCTAEQILKPPVCLFIPSTGTAELL